VGTPRHAGGGGSKPDPYPYPYPWGRLPGRRPASHGPRVSACVSVSPAHAIVPLLHTDVM
jgi:hypothetical protein